MRLSASGLNSLGPWRLPYRALSNGQQAHPPLCDRAPSLRSCTFSCAFLQTQPRPQARADVARVVSSHLALDDFGATVEALSACSCATGVARLVRRLQLESAAQHAQDAHPPFWQRQNTA